MSFAVFKSTTKVFSEYLFTSCIIYDGIVQVFKCKFSCEKSSLGGIHKSLSQRILSCLWYFMNIINSSMMVSSLTIIIAFLKQMLLYIKAIQLILITVQRTALNPLSTSYCIADMAHVKYAVCIHVHF